MIDADAGRARCPQHDAVAFFTCPRCGAFVCRECRNPKDSTEALLRTLQLSVYDEEAARWCPTCLARAKRGPAVWPALMGFGLLLLSLAAAVLALARA